MTDDLDLIPETTVSRQDLMLLGAYVLNSIAAMSAMGHVNPALSADSYMQAPDEPMGKLYHDMLLTCIPRGDDAARKRICRFVDESGWFDRVAEAVTR